MLKFQMPRRILALSALSAVIITGSTMAQTTLETAPAQPLGVLPTFLSPIDPNTACIASAFEPTSQTQMRLKLVIAPGGEIAGLPYLIEPATPSADVRKDYLGLVTAAEGCAPFQAWSAGGEYLLTASVGGALDIKPLELTDPAPGVTAAAPSVSAPSVAAPAITAPAVTAPAGTAIPSFQQPFGFGVSSPELENELALDRAAIRDVQARLLVIGYDPNGVDGVLGRGARAALAQWQTTIGVTPNGYLNGFQLEALKTASQAELDVWLQDPANAAKYTPPARATAKKTSKRTKKKRRVRVCKRNALGMLYDCRNVYR